MRTQQEILKIDRFYSTKIMDENLRFVFLKGLSNAFMAGDELMEKELQRCGFDWVHYYFMEDDFKGIENAYQKHLDDQAEIYYS